MTKKNYLDRSGALFGLLFGYLFCLPVFAGAQPAPASTYEAGILQWRKDRAASLLSENGWLNLAGLYWLKPGPNTFGSARGNKLLFPAGDASIGTFTLRGDTVLMDIAEGVKVFEGEKPVRSLQVWPPAQSGEVPVLHHGSLRWIVIQRGERIGIRLRDLESEVVRGFKGLDYFAIDPAWKVEATLEPAPAGHKLAIQNVLGQTELQDSPGVLVFTIKGKQYRVEPSWEAGKLFIVFADETSGDSTYGGGRFLYAAPPGPDGKTILDFNKAYNPPCAFTAFATCPVPPPQNVLALAVTAGEKTFGEH